jgi:hypothetical protein
MGFDFSADGTLPVYWDNCRRSPESKRNREEAFELTFAFFPKRMSRGINRLESIAIYSSRK